MDDDEEDEAPELVEQEKAKAPAAKNPVVAETPKVQSPKQAPAKSPAAPVAKKGLVQAADL